MVGNACYSHNSDEWETPDWLFQEYDAMYDFDLDVCATPENAKCKRFFTKEDDGLSREWGGQASIQYGAILHTLKYLNGSRRLTKRANAPAFSLLCSSRAEPTRSGFMNTSGTTGRPYTSSEEGYASREQRTTRRSRR